MCTVDTIVKKCVCYNVTVMASCLSLLTVEYRKAQVKEGSVANTYPQLAVKGVGYDRLLGGLEVDVRLRDHLARNFDVGCLLLT